MFEVGYELLLELEHESMRTLSLFLRSQSPPSAQSASALARPALTSCHRSVAMSSLHQKVWHSSAQALLAADSGILLCGQLQARQQTSGQQCQSRGLGSAAGGSPEHAEGLVHLQPGAGCFLLGCFVGLNRCCSVACRQIILPKFAKAKSAAHVAYADARSRRPNDSSSGRPD